MKPLTTRSPLGKPGLARRDSGIVLAVVLVLIFVLVTAVYAFQRRAIVNASITKNRLAASEAEALARGGQRIAEAVVFLARAKEVAEAGGAALDDLEAGEQPLDVAASLLPSGDLWSRMGAFPIQLAGGQTLRVSIEDTGSKLNLNALVPQSAEEEADDDRSSTSIESYEEAEEYLLVVLRHIIDGIDGAAGDRAYDEREIAQNLIDYMDPDDTSLNGRDEDAYYRKQDPPYRARNGPFLSVEEIGLVEGIDPPLLEAMRKYVTVYPIGGTEGINVNRAEPWVLSLLYSGPSGDRELVGEQVVRDIWKIRQKDKILCENASSDPLRCVSPSEVGLGEGSIYPETALPASPSVFRVVSEASVGSVTRRIEAIYDTRPPEGPQLLSWRRLRGPG